MGEELAPAFVDVQTLKKWAKWLRYEADPDYIFEEASKKLSSPTGEPKTMKKVLGEFADEGTKLAMAAGVGSQYALAETVHERYRPLLVSFARQLIAEHNCSTPSEIAVAEMTAASYVRYLDYSRQASTYRRDAFVSKEIDRAHRQFISGLGALRRMKAPPVSVNVTANTAFIGQTQVNGVKNDNG